MFGGECHRRSRKIHPHGTGAFHRQRRARVRAKVGVVRPQGPRWDACPGLQLPTEQLRLLLGDGCFSKERGGGPPASRGV